MAHWGTVNSADYQFEHVVSFSETDAAGVVHFSQMLCWVEDAEHHCLRESGFDVFPDHGGGWPRVSVSCDYHAPCRYAEKVVVFLTLIKLGNSSVGWSFELRVGESLIASGRMTSVRVGGDGKALAFDGEEMRTLNHLLQ